MIGKVLSWFSVALLSAFLVTGCGTGRGTEGPDAGSEGRQNGSGKVIGFSVAGFTAPYFKVLIDYARQEAIKHDAGLLVFDAKWSNTRQEEHIDEFLKRKVDAICVIPADSKAIIPAFRKVKEAGIPLIDVNVQNEPEADHLIDAFVGASMEEEAALAAESIIKLLGDRGGNVVVLEGAEGNFASIHRASGFEQALRDYPNIKIIGRRYTGWEKDKAKSAMKEFLSRYKKIDALHTQDDNIAIGAIEAIKEAGRAGEFPVASISGNIDGYEAVKKGEIYSTVSQPPDWEGITAVQVAVKLMNGEKVEKWVKTPVKLVTRENVAHFKGIW